MERINSVDFLKGVAIVWITVYHVYIHIYGFPPVELDGFKGDFLTQYISGFQFSIWDGIVKVVCGLGYHGVSIFVVMSGFLMMWSNRSRELLGNRANLAGFFKRRILRIYSLYWIAIIIVVIFHSIQGQFLSFFDFEVWPTLLQLSTSKIFVTLVGVQIFIYRWMFLLNPSFWFTGLIIQLYLFFPLIQKIHNSMTEKHFLLLSLAVSLGCLYLSPSLQWIHPFFAMAFFGSWLFLFSLGMVLANNYERTIPILRGLKAIIPFIILYSIGLYLCGSFLTWPLGRLMYGTAITLFLLSVYNSIKRPRVLRIPRRLVEFVGRNSYAMYLINEPYIQAYFVLVTGLTLTFNMAIGSQLNIIVLPAGSFIIVLATYTILVIIASYVLTRVDSFNRNKLIKYVKNLFF